MRRHLPIAFLALLLATGSCGGKGSPTGAPTTAGTGEAPPAAAAPAGRGAAEPFTIVPYPAAGGAASTDPRVTAIRIVPDPSRPSTGLGVEVQGEAPRGKGLEYEIKWEKNGEPVGAGRFLPVPAKRGDTVRVTVLPYDADGIGRAISLEREVHNTPPLVGSPVEATFDNTTWSARVPAEDADGDPLSFRLKDGPAGMTVDEKGRVKWTVPPGYSGSATATVVATDGAGGESEGTFRVKIGSD